jgi:hypothetical protein
LAFKETVCMPVDENVTPVWLAVADTVGEAAGPKFHENTDPEG